MGGKVEVGWEQESGGNGKRSRTRIEKSVPSMSVVYRVRLYIMAR